MDFTLYQISIEFYLSLKSSRDYLYKDSQIISIFSLDINRQVYQSSSLSNSLLNLISSEFELVKRSDAIITLNILYK
jgi:hypothetical protein